MDFFFHKSCNEMYVYSIYTFDLIYKHVCNFLNQGLTNEHVKMLLQKLGVIHVVTYYL